MDDDFERLVATLEDSDVHGVTQARVLHAIARHMAGGVRKSLAPELQVSPGTISKAVTLAKNNGLVEERGAVALRPGRPLIPLTLSPTRWAMIGVAVISDSERPNHLLGMMIGLDGTPFSGFEEPWQHPFDYVGNSSGLEKFLTKQLEEFLTKLIDAFNSICANWQDPERPLPRLLGCGISLGGHVDHDQGVVRSIGWGTRINEWQLKEELEAKLNVTMTCDNDVNSLAVRLNLRPAEEKNDPGDAYALLAVLDHGVGGALVLRHRVRRGHDGMAGEAGHLPVGSVVEACPDGDTGEPWTLHDIPWCHCEEPRVSAATEDRRAESAKEKRPDAQRPAGHVQAFAAPDSIVERARAMNLVEGDGADLIAMLSARSRADNAAISRLFYQGGIALGRAVVSAINWVNPARIRIYLPPALAEENPYLAGSCYREGLNAEVAQSTFTVNYVSKKRLLIDCAPGTGMEKLLASAAAYLVFANLLEKLAPRTPRGVAEYDRPGSAGW